MANYNYDFWAKEHEWKGGGMKDQQLTGSAIDRAFAERRLLQDRAMKKAEHDAKMSIINWNMGSAIQNSLAGLDLTGETGAAGVDAVYHDIGVKLANEGDRLVKEFQRTNDGAAFGRSMAKLQGMVKDIKPAQQQLKTIMANYYAAKENGTLNINAMSEDDVRLLETLATNPDSADFKIDPDTGNLVMYGHTIGSKEEGGDKPWQVGLGNLNQLANKISLVEDTDQVIGDAIGGMLQASDGTVGFNQSVGKGAPTGEEVALGAMKEFLGSEGNDMDTRIRKLRGIMTRNFGDRIGEEIMTKEQFDKILATPPDQGGGYENLVKLLEPAWLERANEMWTLDNIAINNEKRTQTDHWLKNKEEIERNRRRNENKNNFSKNVNSRDLTNMFSPEAWSDNGGMKRMLENNPEEFKNLMQTHLASLGIDDVQFKVSQPTFDENMIPTGGGEIIGVELKSTANIDYTNPNAKPVILGFDEFTSGDYSLENIQSKLYEVIGGSGYQKRSKLGTNDPITSANKGMPQTKAEILKAIEEIEKGDPTKRINRSGELQMLKTQLKMLNPAINY